MFYISWIVALVGFGTILYRSNWLHKMPGFIDLTESLSLTVSGIFGAAIVSTIVMAANIFIPIRFNISIIILCIGLILFAISRKHVIEHLGRKQSLILLGMSLAIFILIPILWLRYYDEGLYYLSAIKWIMESPTPLGLANLHDRLGFNSSWFALCACVDCLVFHMNKPYFILNGIFLFLYFSAVTNVIQIDYWKLINNASRSFPFADLFLVLTVIPVTVHVRSFLASSSPDLSVILLTFIVIYLIITDWENFRSVNVYSHVAVIISAYALTIKLSAAPLLILCIILLIKRYSLWDSRLIWEQGRMSLLYLICLLGITILPWMIRSVLLSGYLLYPSAFGHFAQLQWAVPIEYVVNTSRSVTAWSRCPGPNYLESLSGWGWIVPWFKLYFKHLSGVIIIIASGFFLLAYSFYFNNLGRNQMAKLDPRVWQFPLVISFAGIAFWFFTAPDPRFAYGFLYSFAIIIFCIGLTATGLADRMHKELHRSKALRTAMLVIGLLLCLPSIIIALNPDLANFSFPEPSMAEKKTIDGITIFSPLKKGTDQVWNAPLPNTPYFNRNLRIELSNSTGLPRIFWLPKDYKEGDLNTNQTAIPL